MENRMTNPFQHLVNATSQGEAVCVLASVVDLAKADVKTRKCLFMPRSPVHVQMSRDPVMLTIIN